MTNPAGDFQVNDRAEWAKIVPAGAHIEKLAGDFMFTEGPAWSKADGGFLIFSDIPADEMKKWTPAGGVVTYRKPSHNANGNTRDLQGQLVSCEHSGRRVAIEDTAGNVSTLVDRYQGKRFNSPNDVIVKSDGTVWFTDPPYGLPNQGDGRELDKNFVFRFDPAGGDLRPVIDDFDRPNGLCFSPDERLLYIADSGKPHHVRVFDVQAGGTLTNDRVFCTLDTGIPDGIRCDAHGRLFSSAGNGVHIFAPDGHLIGKIITPHAPGRYDLTKIGPEVVANLTFGGADGTTLFMTACRSIYTIQVSVTGAVTRA